MKEGDFVRGIKRSRWGKYVELAVVLDVETNGTCLCEILSYRDYYGSRYDGATIFLPKGQYKKISSVVE